MKRRTFLGSVGVATLGVGFARLGLAARQDNYHPIRQLMLNILTLDRMIAAKTSEPTSAGQVVQ